MISAASPRSGQATRALLLALTLLAFAHVAFGLGHKNLWWDESLTLQRAESALGPLLRGVLTLEDGITQTPTIDQHPFFYFLLEGLAVRTLGSSEFALRLVSALAATLLVPAVYVLARFFARRDELPASAPLWGALIAATSPFFLWYGQEARPYALWAVLGLLCTYALLRSVDAGAPGRADAARARAWQIGYTLLLACFLTTHYYAVFLLPVHALVVFLALRRRRPRVALGLALAMVAAAALIGLGVLWLVLRQGGGGNFETVRLGMLLPDLLNAFSLGLSVDLAAVRWLDLVFGALALVGGAWLLRRPFARAMHSGVRPAQTAWGWVAPAAVIAPVAMLFLANLVQPVYMNARHMSLIAGFFILLVGAGLGVISAQGRSGRVAAAALALLLLGGAIYSTANYYTRDEYRKDDFAGLGAYMDGRMMAGDAILYYSPAAWRILDYYAPLAAVRTAIAAGAPMALYGVPLLGGDMAQTEDLLRDLGTRYQRIWLIKSATFPYLDPEGAVEAWLRAHFLLVRDAQFYSGSSLRAQLYLPQVPVYEGALPPIQAPTDIVFDDKIRLAGYALDASVWAAGGYGLPLPVTLYWQAVGERPARRYKYILSLVAPGEGAPQTLGTTEREPYEGDIPTTYWDPGKTVAEYVELKATPPAAAASGAPPVLTLRMYDAETLAPLPITQAGAHQVLEDGATVVLPLTPAASAAPQP